MLDLRVVTFTPGAGTTLGTGADSIAASDGAVVAGVPIDQSAVLKVWGAHSPTADTIASAKLQSQDQVDPINGITVQPGTAATLNQWYDYTTLPYKTGQRFIQAGTNTGVVTSEGFTIDAYKDQKVPCIMGSNVMGNDVVTGINTFGGALTADTWGSLPYAPSVAIPNGKYALLGCEVHGLTNLALIRFQHADFGSYQPGFPVATSAGAAAVNVDKVMKDDLMLNSVGEQFVYLSKVLGMPCCPVFTVSNAGTGLNIWMITHQADTPAVVLFLVKVA
jgi:hypothetical protein